MAANHQAPRVIHDHREWPEHLSFRQHLSEAILGCKPPSEALHCNLELLAYRLVTTAGRIR
jgi:hypothetical protein